MSASTGRMANAKPYNYTYADASARASASGFVAADVGKVGLQLDTMITYTLVSNSPVTWQAITPAGLPPTGTAGGVLGGTYPNPSFDATSFATAQAAGIHAATGKTTPVDADELPLADSAASFALKKLTWANVKTTAKAYFDTLYAALAHTHAAADIASGTIAQARLGSGSGGAGTKVLYDDQTYKTPATGFSNPMTTPADLIVGDTAGAAIRLGKGSDGQVLTVDPTTHLLVWATPSSGFANPMTTAGDIILGDTGGSPIRKAKGSDSQVLTIDPTTHLPVWATPSSGFADPTTTKGDLIVHAGSTTRLAVGSNGQVLTADSAQTEGVKWAAPSGGLTELGYVEITSSTNQTNNSTSLVDVVSLSLTITCPATPVTFELQIPVYLSSAGTTRHDFALYDVTGSAVVAYAVCNPTTADHVFTFKFRITPAGTGSRTYKIQTRMHDVAGQTINYRAFGTSPVVPYSLRAVG